MTDTAIERAVIMEAVERNWNVGPDALTDAILTALANAAPSEGGEVCETCFGTGYIEEGAEHMWHSLPCPSCSPEAIEHYAREDALKQAAAWLVSNGHESLAVEIRHLKRPTTQGGNNGR